MPARLITWAWHSKLPGSRDEYDIIASNAHDDALDAIRKELTALAPGNPRAGNSPGAFPWVVFASTEQDGYVRYHVCWWDWTSIKDGTARSIAAVLYLVLENDGPLSYQGMARYAQQQWQDYAAGTSDRIRQPGDLSGGMARDMLRDERLLPWIAHVAALTLRQQVRIVDSPELDIRRSPEHTAAAFDAITALLPGSLRRIAHLTTGTSNVQPKIFSISVGPAPARGTATAVTGVRLPDLSRFPESAEYLETLQVLLDRYGLDDVVVHLAGVAEPERFGVAHVSAATAGLAKLDPITAIGASLLAGEAVGIHRVRALLPANPLAGRVGPEAHLAYLTFLLEHGGPEDLPLLAENWLPEAADYLIHRLAGAFASEDAADWADRSPDVLLRAGADDILHDMFDGGMPGGQPAMLIRPLLDADADLSRTRDWLLTPGHDDQARAAVHADPDTVIGWLTHGGYETPWLRLLTAALSGRARAGQVVTDPGWLMLAVDIGTTRNGSTFALNQVFKDLLAAAAVPGHEVLIPWLESLPAADPVERATADFLLLSMADSPKPPGIRAGSVIAAEWDYGSRLGDLVHRHPGRASVVRAALVRWLADHPGTTHALRILDLVYTSGRLPRDRYLSDVITIGLARPDLIEVADVDTKAAALAQSPPLHRLLTLRALQLHTEPGADVAKLAPDVVNADNLAMTPASVSPLLTTWAGGDPAGWVALTEHTGALITGYDTTRWRWLSTGLDILLPLLEPAAQAEASDAVAAQVKSKAEDLTRQIEALTDERAELDQVLRAAGWSPPEQRRDPEQARSGSAWLAPAPYIGLVQAQPVYLEPEQQSTRRLRDLIKNPWRDAGETP